MAAWLKKPNSLIAIFCAWRLEDTHAPEGEGWI
jgi:hypothetical protein